MTKAKEVLEIKSVVINAIPTGVDKLSIIIALAELQKEFAELIYEDDPQDNNAIQAERPGGQTLSQFMANMNASRN